MSTTATKPAKKTASKKPAPIAASQPEKKAKKTAPLEAASAQIATLPPGELRDIDPDLATLGGAVNDGWFRNGHCTYTTRARRETARIWWASPGSSETQTLPLPTVPARAV